MLLVLYGSSPFIPCQRPHLPFLIGQRAASDLEKRINEAAKTIVMRKQCLTEFRFKLEHPA
jgi:hypothetical protein